MTRGIEQKEEKGRGSKRDNECKVKKAIPLKILLINSMSSVYYFSNWAL